MLLQSSYARERLINFYDFNIHVHQKQKKNELTFSDIKKPNVIIEFEEKIEFNFCLSLSEETVHLRLEMFLFWIPFVEVQRLCLIQKTAQQQRLYREQLVCIAIFLALH